MIPKVLIIHSQPFITNNLDATFRESGFHLIQADDTEDGLLAIKKEVPVAVILDLDAIRFQAFDFCRTLRLNWGNWTPVILMSERDEEFDLVLGLELGADDYIRKPVRPKELVARLKSILRRQTLSWQLQKDETNKQIKNGDLIICPENFSVTFKDKRLNLTMKEFEVVLFLCEKKGTPVTREELLNVLSDEAAEGDPRVIDVFISRIREKLEPHRHKPILIRTVRGVGYMMVEQNSLVY